MGAFAPSPLVDAALEARIMREIVEPVIAGMAAEGHPFRGFLYVGLMLTPDGPKVIEFNVRLGDPEAQVILPLIDEPLAAAPGRGRGGRASTSDVACAIGPTRLAGVVLASRGYPESSESGRPIARRSTRAEAMPGVAVYHAGTARARRSTRHRRRPRADRRRPRRRFRGSDRARLRRRRCRFRSTACSTAATSAGRRYGLKSSTSREVLRHHLRLPRQPGRLARLRRGAACGRRRPSVAAEAADLVVVNTCSVTATRRPGRAADDSPRRARQSRARRSSSPAATRRGARTKSPRCRTSCASSPNDDKPRVVLAHLRRTPDERGACQPDRPQQSLRALRRSLR